MSMDGHGRSLAIRVPCLICQGARAVRARAKYPALSYMQVFVVRAPQGFVAHVDDGNGRTSRPSPVVWKFSLNQITSEAISVQH